MNKYSAHFNDMIPKQAGLYSAGYPDGVWIISIIYCFVAFASAGVALFGIYKIISGSDAGHLCFKNVDPMLIPWPNCGVGSNTGLPCKENIKSTLKQKQAGCR